MELQDYIIAVSAGFIAGIVNTLAGSGSLFTLPALLFMGLSPHLANGTNRVGILTQTFVGSYTLYKRGGVKIGSDYKLIFPTIAGSVCGALIATGIPEQTLKITIGVVMLLLLVVILSRYNELLQNSVTAQTANKKVIAYPVLFIIGMYGGFIQLGVGIFALSALLLLLNYSFNHGNALKNMLNFCMTLPAFIIFAINKQIVWEVGVVVAAGQTTGAWVAARYAVKSQSATIWIRRLLILMTAFTAMELFGINRLLKELFTGG